MASTSCPYHTWEARGAYTINLADLFLIPLVLYIARDHFEGRRPRIRTSGLVICWGAMIGLGMLNMLLGPYRHIAGHEVFRMLKCLVLFLVIANEVQRPKQFIHVFSALAIGIAFQSMVAMIQFAFRANLGLQFLGEATEESIKYASETTYRGASNVFRVGGLMGHPNLMAAYLALLLPMCLSVVFSRVNALLKAGAVVAVAAGSAALLLTLSRTGWISFAIGFVSLLLLSFMHPILRRRYFLVRAGLIVATAVAALAFSGPIVKRFTQSDPGALSFRYEWNQVAWKMIKEKPIMGFGLNSFVFNMPKYTRYAGPQKMTERFGRNWPVVHNIYLLTWAEQGTIGFLWFLALNIYLLWLAFKNAKNVRDLTLYTMNIGLMSGLIALMVDGLGSFFVRNPSCGRVFWIVAALIVAIYYREQENRAAEAPAQRCAAPIRPVLAPSGQAATE